MPITHLHKSLQLGDQEIVQLVLDCPATVYLLDSNNYYLFMQDRPCEFHGTEVVTSPFLMNPPHAGAWELVIFTSTPGKSVNAEISIVER